MMSTQDSQADCAEARECPVIDGRHQLERISARTSDVGGIPVARLLPHRTRRLIGAWCFLDHAGPVRFAEGAAGLRVGPHPHTSLQTFTWMIRGEVLHRDSLGHEQVIRPGQVNLMTAGHGISHTEESVAGEQHLHAAQLWIALPHADRNTPPRFDHYPNLPQFDLGAIRATLLTGQYSDYRAPTLQFSPLVGMELLWSEQSSEVLELQPEFEYGLLSLEGLLEVDGENVPQDELVYLGANRDKVTVAAADGNRTLLIGGEPLAEEITIWWNFVGHSKAEIEQAQRDWEAGSDRFGVISAACASPMSAPPIPW